MKLVLLLECDTPRARCFKEVIDIQKGTTCAAVGFIRSVLRLAHS